MEDGRHDTLHAARERFLLLCAEARKLDVHIGLVRGERHVWVATLHEPTGGEQMAWLITMLPWGTHLVFSPGLTVRVDAPSRTASFWGELARGCRDVAEAARRLHARRADAQTRCRRTGTRSTK